MPLDGHHRFAAHQALRRPVDAWLVDGRAFDRLCTRLSELCIKDMWGEDLTLCGGIPAMRVADAWSPEDTPLPGLACAPAALRKPADGKATHLLAPRKDSV
jgi:hypothetical protein